MTFVQGFEIGTIFGVLVAVFAFWFSDKIK